MVKSTVIRGTGKTIVNGEIKPVSVDFLTPRVIIQWNEKTPPKWNYCHVPTFISSTRDAYYFIQRWEYVGQNIYKAYLKLDALMTYRDVIYNASSRGFVTESTTENKYLSNRNVILDKRGAISKMQFQFRNLFTNNGAIIMTTLKGKE